MRLHKYSIMSITDSGNYSLPLLMPGAGGQDRVSTGDSEIVSTFEIRSKKCKVTLSKKLLTWEQEGSPCFRHNVPTEEIVAVKFQHTEGRSCCQQETWIDGEVYHCPRHTCLDVYYVQHIWKHRWKCQSVSLQHTDPNVVAHWVAVLQNLIRGFTCRPRSLLILINPCGGRQKGESVFVKRARPLFRLAGIKLRVIVTERANHAMDMLQNPSTDVENFDGVVAVGGDGMFAEVFNGLFFRALRDHKLDPTANDFVLPELTTKVGIIPCGSTDTVAFSIYGTNDVETTVLQTILGESLGLDVCSVHNDESLIRLAVSMISYGYFGDTLVESEKLRWMGPKRYDYAGFKKLMRNGSYSGQVELLVDSQSSPTNSTWCRYGCTRCENAREEEHPGCEWVKVCGDFMAVSSFTMPCACKLSPQGVSPYAHLGDGCTDVVLVKKTSRFNYLRYLLRTAGSSETSFDLPYVESYRVREFRFRPLCKSKDGYEPCKPGIDYDNSSWNCDGEIVPDAALRVKVHCQPLKVFSRGVPTEEGRCDNCSICGDNTDT